jgi:glycosyltransferase involved in cell wall biosynthesis
MKIAFFSVSLITYGGGAEKYFIDVANNIAARGNEVSIINLDEDFYKKFTIMLSIFYHTRGVSTRLTDEEVRTMLKNVEWIKVSLRNLKKVLKQFDVIYTKNEIPELVILKLLGFQNLPPVIVGVHTPIYYPIVDSFYSKIHNFLYSSSLYGWLIKDSKAIHVNNSENSRLLKKFFPELNLRIYTIFCPFEFKHSICKKYEKDRNTFTILFVGRLTMQKGIDTLVKIIEKLSVIEIFKNIRFTIIGSGDESLEKLLASLQRKFPNVRWLGYVPNEELHRPYSSSDILILPSKWETLSYVCLEAQSYGLPVIATDIPGPRDIIVNGQTGFLVKNTPEEFVQKIKYLYELKKNIPEKFAEFSIKARENIRRKFDPGVIYTQLEKMFQDVCSKNSKV